MTLPHARTTAPPGHNGHFATESLRSQHLVVLFREVGFRPFATARLNACPNVTVSTIVIFADQALSGSGQIWADLGETVVDSVARTLVTPSKKSQSTLIDWLDELGLGNDAELLQFRVIRVFHALLPLLVGLRSVAPFGTPRFRVESE